MPERIESVRALSVPRDLSLRLAIGQALEMLELRRALGELPPDGATILRSVAIRLRPTSPTILEVGRSLGDSRDEMTLIRAASAGLRLPKIEDLVETLDKAAADLERLAVGESLEETRMDSLHAELSQIRDAIAASRASASDETIVRR
ncbi:MAG: hypothetical protein M3279_10290 [Actinomycetota bacterium]|nr:hypothetical protein [Actinomycetota bacterium]